MLAAQPRRRFSCDFREQDVWAGDHRLARRGLTRGSGRISLASPCDGRPRHCRKRVCPLLCLLPGSLEASRTVPAAGFCRNAVKSLNIHKLGVMASLQRSNGLHKLRGATQQTVRSSKESSGSAIKMGTHWQFCMGSSCTQSPLTPKQGGQTQIQGRQRGQLMPVGAHSAH